MNSNCPTYTVDLRYMLETVDRADERYKIGMKAKRSILKFLTYRRRSNFTEESREACKARLEAIFDLWKAGELTQTAAVEQIGLATDMLKEDNS